LTPSASSLAEAHKRPIRTLVAEDSPTVRRLLVEMLSSDPAFQVVGEAADGAEALQKAIELSPDLITMDVHMPNIDGIDATKAIMREAPTPILVVTAAAVRNDVELSMNAMQAGALMVVDKPVDPRSPAFEQQRDQLLTMAKAMSAVKVVRRWGETMAPGRIRSTVPKLNIRLVAIGTSTGGPAALHRILTGLSSNFPVPIVVVQHIARGFVGGLAHWLSLNSPLSVKVATDQERLRAGVVYLAPDNNHFGMTSDGRIRLSSAPPVGGFRPSADYLFEAAGSAFGADVLGVILTGMGRDGVRGLETIHARGGRVIAQDETSSIVYGMAQEAVKAGVVDEILPLESIGSRMSELLSYHV
jgi:two-component system, chemotaxis family, protein-glutamate methylesterase/glutaminase